MAIIIEGWVEIIETIASLHGTKGWIDEWQILVKWAWVAFRTLHVWKCGMMYHPNITFFWGKMMIDQWSWGCPISR